MVECSIDLDMVFASLSDQTRRELLQHVIERPRSIRELAEPYAVSFSAIAKQVGVLESACLVQKRREGKQQIISANPKALKAAATYLKTFEKMWGARFDALETYLKHN